MSVIKGAYNNFTPSDETYLSTIEPSMVVSSQKCLAVIMFTWLPRVIVNSIIVGIKRFKYPSAFSYMVSPAVSKSKLE